MRICKILFALAGLLAVVRYGSVYYTTWQFEDFVRHQSSRVNSGKEFKKTIIQQAQAYSLPVSESDVDIRLNGAVMRVSVNYTVPLDLVVYQPKLKFHVLGSGLLRK
jgi:hypothetical protein